MIQMLKHMKKNIPWVVLIFLLLLGQAFCDLTLPEYTSRIIDTGIQQKGIVDAVPDTIRGETLLGLVSVSEDPRDILERYQKQGSEDALLLSDLSADEIYELRNISDEERKTLSGILEESELLLFLVQKEGIAKEQLADPQILKALQQKEETLKEQYPETMVHQIGVQFAAREYEAQGISLDRKQSSYVTGAGIRMLAMSAFSMLAAVIVTLLASRVAAELGKDLRNRVYKKVMGFSSDEMNHFSTASLITRSTNDIAQVQLVMTLILRMVLYAPILAVGGLIKVVHTGSYLSWTLGAGIGMIAVVMAVLFSLAIPKFRRLQELIDRLNLIAREILTGIPVIRAFSAEKHEEARFDAANGTLTRTNLFVNRVMASMMPLMMLILNVVSILVIYAGSHGVGDGKLQVGDMMAFIQYAMQIIFSFLMMTMIAVFMPRANVSAKRIEEILNTRESIQNPEQGKIPERQDGTLVFENVSFRYPGAEELVLKNISFQIKSGWTFALIGGTGSGKSTLLNLIPRFFDVTEGRILLDGVDIREMDLHVLRERLGYVPQKSVLFSGSIASNLRFGKEEASDQELERAVEAAQAAEFVSQKEDGIHAHIAQGGSNVSGGQKQRLAIARAIAKEPEIYLFDDSFSALDFKTDAKLRRRLKEEKATKLIVGQRISTIMDADQILVLDDGEAVGIGTHEELLKNCEVYRQIAKSQLSEEELAV